MLVISPGITKECTNPLNIYTMAATRAAVLLFVIRLTRIYIPRPARKR